LPRDQSRRYYFLIGTKSLAPQSGMLSIAINTSSADANQKIEGHYFLSGPRPNEGKRFRAAFISAYLGWQATELKGGDRVQVVGFVNAKRDPTDPLFLDLPSGGWSVMYKRLPDWARAFKRIAPNCEFMSLIVRDADSNVHCVEYAGNRLGTFAKLPGSGGLALAVNDFVADPYGNDMSSDWWDNRGGFLVRIE
jgi:hypothetical protein